MKPLQNSLSTFFNRNSALPQSSSPSLCEQSELQCFASGLRCMFAQRRPLKARVFKIQIKSSLAPAPLQRRFAAGPHNRLLRRQHCSSLCSQSEGHEHVANMTKSLGHNFVVILDRACPPQTSSPSLCEQSELQCFASGLRCMFAQRRPLKGRVFKIQIQSSLAAAPSQRRIALARIIVCCGASIVAHFARKVRATNK